MSDSDANDARSYDHDAVDNRTPSYTESDEEVLGGTQTDKHLVSGSGTRSALFEKQPVLVDEDFDSPPEGRLERRGRRGKDGGAPAAPSAKGTSSKKGGGALGNQSGPSTSGRTTDGWPTRVKDLDFINRHLPSNTSARVPRSWERPWDAPEGYICVYESYFRSCFLTYPLPRPLLDFCALKDIALSQLGAMTVLELVALMTLGAEVGVTVDADFIARTVTLVACETSPGTFYTQGGVLTKKPSKIDKWQYNYFYLEKTPEVMGVGGPRLRTTWNRELGSVGMKDRRLPATEEYKRKRETVFRLPRRSHAELTMDRVANVKMTVNTVPWSSAVSSARREGTVKRKREEPRLVKSTPPEGEERRPTGLPVLGRVRPSLLKEVGLGKKEKRKDEVARPTSGGKSPGRLEQARAAGEKRTAELLGGKAPPAEFQKKKRKKGDPAVVLDSSVSPVRRDVALSAAGEAAAKRRRLEQERGGPALAQSHPSGRAEQSSSKPATSPRGEEQDRGRGQFSSSAPAGNQFLAPMSSKKRATSPGGREYGESSRNHFSFDYRGNQPIVNDEFACAEWMASMPEVQEQFLGEDFDPDLAYRELAVVNVWNLAMQNRLKRGHLGAALKMTEKVSLLESKNERLTKRVEDLVVEKETLLRDVEAADGRTETARKELSNAVVDMEHGLLREEQLKHDVASRDREIQRLTVLIGEKETQLEAREAAEEERRGGAEVVIRRHLKARLRWENMDRLLSQAEGTLEYLEAMRGNGVAIPKRTIRRLRRKKLRCERRLARLAYRDISAESLALGSVEMTAESEEEVPFSASSDDTEEEDSEGGEKVEEEEYDEDVEGNDEDIGVRNESDEPRSDSRVAAEISEKYSPLVDAEPPTSGEGKGLVDGAEEQADEKCEVGGKEPGASTETVAAVAGEQTPPVILEMEDAVPASAVPSESEAVVPAGEQELIATAAVTLPGNGTPRVEAELDDAGGPVEMCRRGDEPRERERGPCPLPGGGGSGATPPDLDR